MRRPSSSVSGFTLIELLIVVAIIGILAAIAIPNFLQAQVRAKLSATRSNLRTISMAVEVYRLDCEKYPLDHEWIYPFFDRMKQLTTPIDYMSSIVADPFTNEGIIMSWWSSHTSRNAYLQDNGSISPVLTYDYAMRQRPDGNYDPWLSIVFNDNSVEWVMRGVGPDLVPAWLGYGMPAYDPSNGTISFGQVYWAGPGHGETAPLYPNLNP